MHHTKLFALLVATIIVGVGCGSSEPTNTNGTTVPVDQGTTTNATSNTNGITNEAPGGILPEEQTYTLADVAEHATEDDCWLAVEGKVYDVTTFIPSHPGGEAILEGCGTDATAMFNAKPTNGEEHSANAETMLEEYYLGMLEQ